MFQLLLIIHNRFPSDYMSKIQHYFEYDWLLSRAFVAICFYKDVFIHIRSCDSIVPFICWKVGFLCTSQIKFEDKNEVL